MAIGVLCALFAAVFRYVDDHFYTPETFFENTSELAGNADIRQHLFDEFKAEIIALADGEALDSDTTDGSTALDDALEALNDEPDPFTEERILRDIEIEEVLKAVFDSDAYTEVFEEALERTQPQFVRSAELESRELLSDQGEIFFDMRRLYRPIYDGLAQNSLTAEITTNEVPADYGVFKIGDRDTTLSTVWTLLRIGPDWRGLLTFVAIASFIGALFVAERRPSSAIQYGFGLIGVAVIVIVIVYLVRFIIPVLTDSASSAGAVAANYVANTWPLVRTMVGLAVLGVVIAALGGIAKLIWPDDWVYSSVSDERGVRSVRQRRRKAEADAEPAAAAAAVQVPVQHYPQPYPGYPPPGWGTPYPGQYPPPGYGGYPAGPYAQPQPMPQQYASPGRPTVPVMPVQQSRDELVPPAAPPLDPGADASDELPSDAVQIIPKVQVGEAGGDAVGEADGEATQAVDAVSMEALLHDDADDDEVNALDAFENSGTPGASSPSADGSPSEPGSTASAAAAEGDDSWAEDRDW